MQKNYKEMEKIFKAFCDEKRLQVLAQLQEGEKCLCNLLENIDLCQSSLSYHMKILVESGIVSSRQEGKWTHFKINTEGSNLAIDLLKEITEVNEVTKEGKCCD